VQGVPELLELLAEELLLALPPPVPVPVVAVALLPTAPPAPLLADEEDGAPVGAPAPDEEPKRVVSTPPHAWVARRAASTVGTTKIRAKRRGERLRGARIPINLGMIRDSYASRQGFAAEHHFTAACNAR
jgi:hypothetical protein